MATQTETFVESSTLVDHGSKQLSHAPTTLASPANATSGISGPTTNINSTEPATQALPKNRSIIVIIQLAGISFMTSFQNGLVTVALPAISDSLKIHPNLLLWPMSAFALTSGSCLLVAGACADVIGPRLVNLTGCFFISVFILASAFSQTGIQLIMFRAMQGVASALALPTALSIISSSVKSGKPRNIGFACVGLAMPLGFSFGLVLGGVFVDGPGWRTGAYVGGAASFLLFVVGIWALPLDRTVVTEASVWRRLGMEIDWVGASLVSGSIALFSYVLAMLSSDINNMKHAANIVLLFLSIALVAIFGSWMHHQERLNRPALIPNSLWRRVPFTSVCLMVLLSNAVVNSMELFSSLFFQEVQGHSALGASIRILPNMILGICVNFVTGYFVNKLPAICAVLVSSGLCAVAPLLMALINPQWPYWYDAFFAQLLSPMSADVLFTVGILIISDVFPTKTQALAGAVFNTFAQLGTSIGISTMSVISIAVTGESEFKDKNSPQALMQGYRATFWTLFAWMTAACIIAAFGLRKIGKIGEKRD